MKYVIEALSNQMHMDCRLIYKLKDEVKIPPLRINTYWKNIYMKVHNSMFSLGSFYFVAFKENLI